MRKMYTIPKVLNNGKPNEFFVLVGRWLKTLQAEGLVQNDCDPAEKEEITIPEEVLEVIEYRFADEYDRYIKKIDKWRKVRRKINAN